jgi:regulator of protease activity HflC (stomatin/prohibitin superfamily)
MMDIVGFLVAGAVVTILAALLVWRASTVVTVHDYETALVYRNGVLSGTAAAGRHRLFGERTRLDVHDTRPTMMTVGGQEITTSDHIPIRLSLVGQVHPVDVVKAYHDTRDSHGDLYLALQLAVRDDVSRRPVDEVLLARDAIAAAVLAAVQPRAAAMGLELNDLAVRDIMLPADLKRAMAGVVQAQKETQRALEKARGEQAVLRNLANTGRLFEGNPGLLQARLIQALETGGNTLVFGGDGLTTGKVKPGKG